MIRSITFRLVLTASIFAAIFHVLLPVGLIFLMALLLSFLSVMDPLHAKKHVEVIWYGFTEILVFQMLLFFVITIVVIFLSAFAASRWSRRNAYLAAAGFSLVTHYVVFSVLAFICYLVGRSDFLASGLMLYYFYFVIIGPLMGLLCIALGSRREVVPEPGVVPT